MRSVRGGPLRRIRALAREGRDRGSVAVFVAAIVPALLAVFGLVLDLGQQLRAQRTAAAVAQEAARAGVESVDLGHYRGGALRVDAATAAAAARGYLAAAGYSGLVRLTGPATLSVTVTVTRPTQVLGMVGISSWNATETARANLEEG